MQLKRLEAYGFKSFADKITIEFDHGITAIVGPNGSGKSNITDAVRWVLGEQNIRNLRGTRSEDIIFAGSAQRRPLNIAEVSLIFDNDGTLPVDFREVAVTRRLYRSGESEYFINRSRCRLKDIYQLFADTGIGHDGMSIIGQNRMEDILNSRPEDRRAFFEETAGITKFRDRKRETVKKLTDTEANLLRVQDIMQEIETQLEPLARHAEKTRQYNALHEAYQKCKLTKFARSARREAERKAANEAKLQKVRDESLGFETAVKQAAAEREALQKEILELEQRMRDGAEANEALRQKLEAANREIAALEERQGQSGAEKARIEARRTELQAALVQSVREIGRLSGEAAEKKRKLAEADAHAEGQQERAAKMAAIVAERKKAAETLSKQREAKQEELAAAKQVLAILDRDIEAGSEGRAERQAAIAAAKAKQSSLEKQQQELTASFAEKEAALQQAVKAQQQARHAQQQAQQEKLAQRAASLQEKIDFLQHMQEEYEGFGKAPKAVLQSKEPWHDGVAGAIAELLTIPAAYMTAIEIALGGNQQNIVTEDTETAKEAIAFLKRKHLGRVTFLPLSTLSVQYPKDREKEAERGAGAIGWANELVEVEEKYRKAADFLLARILVVDTLDNALALAKKQDYRLRIVTLSGEFLAPGGSLSGGGRSHREASFLNRSGEIESLHEKRTAAREKLKEKQAEVQQAAEAAAEAERRQSEALALVQQQSVARAEARVSLERLKESLAAQAQVVQELIAADAKRQATFAENQNKRVLQARSVKLLVEAVEAAKKQAEESLLDLEDVEQDAAALGKCMQEEALQRTVLEQEWKRSAEQMALYRQEKQRGEQSLAELEQEEKQLATRTAESTARLQELERSSQGWQDSFDAAQKKQRDLYGLRMEKMAAGQELEAKGRELSRKLSRKQEEAHQLEILAAKIQMTLQDSQQAILHEFGLTPERALEEALDLEPQELRNRMQSLKRQMDAIGPVNPNAVEEYESLQKRHAFMKKQSTDLIEAKENLGRILAEMDEAMTKQFQSAFADIQRYFGEIFVRLFGGGKAELKMLDESDVLHTGIDILVTLPQKKRQSLAALSGGERALTVIALLFAFLRYRPSPFSVLDEIDAPLDEANVMRFGRFLQEFAEQTQFIVVTHRKGTMEVADTMYGVTVEESGVSRLLSVRLDELDSDSGAIED